MRVSVSPHLSLVSCRSSGTAGGLHRRLLDNSVGGVLANNNNIIHNSNNNGSNSIINPNAGGPPHLLLSGINHDIAMTTVATTNSHLAAATTSTHTIDQNQCVNEVLMTLDTKLLSRLMGTDEATTSTNSVAVKQRPGLNTYLSTVPLLPYHHVIDDRLPSLLIISPITRTQQFMSSM